MAHMISAITLVVGSYDEALAWYRDKLGFVLLEDTPLDGGKRWVRVAPPGGQGTCLLLAEAASEEQEARIGNQTGGRVGFFLETGDFWADYEAMKSRGVRFEETPREEPYGTVAVFRDLHGNLWDLLEPNRP
ncbi:VOC family protein [Mesorhizobium xinjiangense]|uniref:VOC family protein n=1 Tax=Mesorhizobium xinjiangense TaxID=2678685 RepID=UPI0012EEC45A|nr:VOC family protein [Mesorhizobium xinjiangense]